MPEVKFKVKFLDWEKGDTAMLDKDVAERYISQGTCSLVKPPGPRKKKVDAAPHNKMVTGAANK